jgi:prepilin-type N-terminal cleavage/methylation domain-containing protein
VNLNAISIMKTQPLRRTNGFTLVELLVVITIIAVLAGAGFAAGNSAIQKAKKTTALATCTALESAVSNFYTEYGAMPTDKTTDTPALRTDNDTLLKILLGLEGTGTTVLNTRSIKFLSVKEGKKKGASGGINGLIYKDSGAVTGLFDPWGGPYFVMLDADYDERVAPTPSAGGTAVTLNGRRAAAWSKGADAVSGSGGKASDDVTSWK